MNKLLNKILSFVKKYCNYILAFVISTILLLALKIILSFELEQLFIILFIIYPLVLYLNKKVIEYLGHSKNSKKIIFAVIIFSCIFSFSFYSLYAVPKQKVYIKTIPSELMSKKNNIIMIQEVKSGPFTINQKKIKTYIEYDENGKLANEIVTIKTYANQKLNITYSLYEDNAAVIVERNNKKIKQDLSNNINLNRTFSYGKVTTDYPIWKQIIKVLIMITFMFVFNLYLLTIINNTKKLLFLLPLSSFLIVSILLKTELYTTIISTLIIMLSSFLTVKFFESNYLKKYLTTKKQKIGIAIVGIVLTFMICGKALFMSSTQPFDISLSAALIFLFIFLYSLMIEFSFFYFMEYFSDKIKNNKSKKTNYLKIFIIIFIIFFGVAYCWAINFYPGNMTADSFGQWAQVSANLLTNIHPYWSTLLLKGVFIIFKNPFAMIILQTLVFSLLFAGILTYLCKRGFSYKTIIIIALLIALCPSINITNITLWKDIPFTIAFISLLIVSYKTYLLIINKKLKWYHLVLLVVLILLTSNLRYNGIFILYFLSIYFIIVGIKYKNKKTIITLIALLLLFNPLNNLIIKTANIKMTDLGGSKYTSVIKNFVATNYYDGNLSEEANKKLNQLNKKEDFSQAYSGSNIDNMFYSTPNPVDKWFPIIAKYKITNIIPLYLENIIKNPLIFVRDKLDGMSIMWNYDTPKDASIYAYDIGMYNSSDPFERKMIKDQLGKGIEEIQNIQYSNFLITNVYNNILDFSYKKPVNIFFWKSAIGLTLILLVIFYVVINKKKEIWAMLVPMIAYTLSWCIALNHQSFRYIYYLYLGSIVILLFSMLSNDKVVKKRSRKK